MSGLIKQKIDVSKIFDCKNFKPFAESVVEILTYRGVSMSGFYICELEGVRFLVKLSFYNKSNPEIYGVGTDETMSTVDAEIKILTILRDKIIATGISPCILELVYDKVCTGVSQKVTADKCDNKNDSKKSEGIAQENIDTLLCHHYNYVNAGLAHDKCAFIVLEKCDMTLLEYMRKIAMTPINVAVFKTILFQIVYTMYAITTVYPGFRHYDLHDGNIMLKIDYKYKYNASRPKYMKFIVGKRAFFIPYFGIIAKIIDFGFSKIPEEGVISSFSGDKVNMFYRSENDLLFLFHEIYMSLKDSPDIVNLLNNLEPEGLYIDNNTSKIRRSENVTSYSSMISDKVFDEYNMVVEPNPGDVIGIYTSK